MTFHQGIRMHYYYRPWNSALDLWSDVLDDNGCPMGSVEALHSSEPCPEGFKRVRRAEIDLRFWPGYAENLRSMAIDELIRKDRMIWERNFRMSMKRNTR